MYLWSLGMWFILVGMWAFTYVDCCYFLFMMLDFVRSGTKTPFMLSSTSDCGICNQLLQLLGLDLPASMHWILNGELKKNAKTFFFIMLFCRYSIFINYFFDFYCKYFFPTMFQFLLNPLYLLSPKNAHPLFLSLVRQQIKSSNRKKEKQTNTQRNFLKKLNKRRNIKNTDWIIY